MKFTAPPVRVPDDQTIASLNGIGTKIRAPPNVGNVYIRTPNLSRYQISENGEGKATLFPSLNNLSTPAGTSMFVGRRQRTLTPVTTASLFIAGLGKGIHAGLALYKDHLRYVSLNFEPSTRRVSLRVVTLDNDATISNGAPAASDAQYVRFKTVSFPMKWAFFVNTRADATLEKDDGGWFEMGSLQVWQIAAREMTGPMLGIFAHASDERADSTPVEFLQFEVRDE
jgi:hypothetical protein